IHLIAAPRLLPLVGLRSKTSLNTYQTEFGHEELERTPPGCQSCRAVGAKHKPSATQHSGQALETRDIGENSAEFENRKSKIENPLVHVIDFHQPYSDAAVLAGQDGGEGARWQRLENA